MALTLAAVAALNLGDVEGYLSFFSAGALRWVAGVEQPFTKDDIREQLVALAIGLESLVLEEQLIFGSDGHVFARWIMRGKHVGPLFGIPATGRAIEVESVEVYAFEGPTITASQVYGDPMSLLRQVGVSV